MRRLSEFSKTLDGFEIAQMDLKYRQSGDLLSGDTQSGVEFRWFDMSEDVQILEEIQAKGSVKPPLFLI